MGMMQVRASSAATACTCTAENGARSGISGLGWARVGLCGLGRGRLLAAVWVGVALLLGGGAAPAMARVAASGVASAGSGSPARLVGLDRRVRSAVQRHVSVSLRAMRPVVTVGHRHTARLPFVRSRGVRAQGRRSSLPISPAVTSALAPVNVGVGGHAAVSQLAGAAIDPACIVQGGFEACTYPYSSTQGQDASLTVPALTSSTAFVEAAGGSGGDASTDNHGRFANSTASGGYGGYLSGYITVASGDQLLIATGGKGGDAGTGQSGGWPDGGSSGAGGGGGSSNLSLKRSGETLYTPFLFAAGGGGAGGEGGSDYPNLSCGVQVCASATAVPLGGAGGEVESAGEPGQAGGSVYCTPVGGGSPGQPGSSTAGGAGGASASSCGPGPGPSDEDGGDGAIAPARAGTGGIGFGLDVNFAGWGGGGGGGLTGGGGGGAGGSFDPELGGTDVGYDLDGAGGGGGGGSSGYLPTILSQPSAAVWGIRGDGFVNMLFAVGDITPPVTTIDSAPADTTDQTDATITFSGTDAGTGTVAASGIAYFQCQLDGGAWATCSSPKTYPGLSTGTHTVSVRAVDNNGNMELTPATTSWTFVDNTPPTMSIPSPPADPSYLPSVSIAFTGSDTSGADGIHLFECQLDGGGFAPCGSPATYSGLSVGAHSFEIYAVDRGGNVSNTVQANWTVSDAADPSTCTTSGTVTTCPYPFTSGFSYRTWTVPAGVTHATITADGAGGGATFGHGGGLGGRVQARVPVTPGETLRIYLGAQGSNGGDDTCDVAAFNGGGGAGCGLGSPVGGGGGASDVRRSPFALADRIVVAGGGGGAGFTGAGGDGGGAVGADGADGGADDAGGGGTATDGGAAGATDPLALCDVLFSSNVAEPGVLGAGGSGVDCGLGGGGGGGGYYGGGGGGNSTTYSNGAVTNQTAGGGGGGSSFATSTATDVTLTTGEGQSGDGQVQIASSPAVSQTITVTNAAPSSAAYGTSFTVTATGGGSGNPVTYSGSGACSNTGPKFTMTSSTGTCTVTYNQAGDDNYDPAPQVQESVTAQKASQTINVTTHAPASAAYGTSFTVAATDGGGSPNPVTYAGSGACSNSGSTFMMTSSTSICTVTYDQAGDDNYDPAPQVQETVTAQKASQTISVTTHAPPSAAYGTSFTVAATDGGGSPNPVTYSGSGACSNTGPKFTMTSSTGTCTVTYDQAGDTNYDPAPQVQESVTAQKASQAIRFTSTPPASPVYGGSYTVTATGGASGNSVVFSIDRSSTAGACSISGAKVLFTSAGSCVIDANQAGTASYAPAPQVQQTLTIVYSKTVSGNSSASLTVTAGQGVLIAPGARVNAPVNVLAGGSLDIEGATVTGPLTATGGVAIKACGSTITGPVTITADTGQVTFGDGGSCAGNTITGPVKITGGTGTGVTFDNNTVTGPLTITHDKGTINISHNKVTGPTTTTPNP